MDALGRPRCRRHAARSRTTAVAVCRSHPDYDVVFLSVALHHGDNARAARFPCSLTPLRAFPRRKILALAAVWVSNLIGSPIVRDIVQRLVHKCMQIFEIS